MTISELFTELKSIHKFLRYLILNIYYIKMGFKHIYVPVSCEQSKPHAHQSIQLVCVWCVCVYCTVQIRR